jgi:hypothetical protein
VGKKEVKNRPRETAKSYEKVDLEKWNRMFSIMKKSRWDRPVWEDLAG